MLPWSVVCYFSFLCFVWFPKNKSNNKKKKRGQVDKLICQSGILRSTCTFYVKWKKPAEASSLIFARQINFLSVLLGKVEKDFFVCAKTSKTNKQKTLQVFLLFCQCILMPLLCLSCITCYTKYHKGEWRVNFGLRNSNKVGWGQNNNKTNVDADWSMNYNCIEPRCYLLVNYYWSVYLRAQGYLYNIAEDFISCWPKETVWKTASTTVKHEVRLKYKPLGSWCKHPR